MNKLIADYVATRKKRKLSQTTLSQRLHTPQSHLSAIENGHVDPRLSTFTDLVALVGLVPMLVPREYYYAVKGLISDNPQPQPKIVLEDLE